MGSTQPSFKIYVGSFPEKTAIFSGNGITLYQINPFKYELAKSLENVVTINDFNDDVGGYEICPAGILDCNERLTVPVIPNNCSGGGTGPAGPQGPQGPAGANGANGQDGRTTVIALNPVVPLSCNDDPEAEIGAPVVTGNIQTQTLTFKLPSGCGGGGGGPIFNSSASNGNTTSADDSQEISLFSGINVDLGADNPGTPPNLNKINVRVNSKAIGFIRLLGYNYDAAENRWLYSGTAQVFMSNYNLTSGVANTSLSGTLLDVFNVAEEGYSLCIPVNAEKRRTTAGICCGFNVFASSYQNATIVPLYHTLNSVGQDVWFINQPNPFSSGIKTKAKIINSTLFTSSSGTPSSSDAAKWKYTVEFCRIQYSNPDTDIPATTPEAWYGESHAIVYNALELSNTAARGYGYSLTGGFSPANQGFRVQGSSSFYFKAVPNNTIVDLEVDDYGNFYFKELNPIDGGC